MPEEGRSDDVETFLVEQKSMEDRKQTLIEDLLPQKESAINAFDKKLAKLSYVPARSRQAEKKPPQ